MSFRKMMAHHPGFEWACGAAEFILVDVMLILGITSAWATPLVIPITDKITINFGELPQWIVALVAAGGLWKAWRAEAAANRSEAASHLNAATLTSVSKQIDGLLADRDKGKIAEGEAKATAAGEAKAEQLAEGQRQGIELGRDMPAREPGLTGHNGSPVPVADVRVGDAVDRMADATGKVADATDALTQAKK